MTLARVDLANLVYLAGALLAATVVSAVYLLRHRKPRSMEAAITAFSRELRALAPDSGSRRPPTTSTSVTPGSSQPADGARRRRSGPDGERARNHRTERARPAPEAGDGETG